NDYSSGYQLVATEMLGRIRSHPNRIIDNMVSPNNSLHLTHPRVPRSARRPAVRRSIRALGDKEASGTRKRLIDKTRRLLLVLAILRIGQSHQSLPPSGECKQII